MTDQSKSMFALLRAGFEQSPFGISVASADRRIVATNPAYAEMLGRTIGEMASLDIDSITRDADQQWTDQYLRRLEAGEITVVDTDKTYVLPDGGERTLHLTSWPIIHEGHCIGFIGVHSEVPTRAGLADGRVRKLIENIDNTVSLIDADGRLIETSGRYRPVLGYPAEFWETRTIFDLLHPEDAKRVLDLRENVLAEPGCLIEEEVRVQGVTGDYEPIHIAAVNLLDDPDVGGIVITSRNVAAERALTDQLAERTERAEKEALLRSRLIATVSHELRNPLHAMHGLSELLAMSDLPPEATTLATTLHRQVEALTAVLDDLLESSRLDASGVDLRPTPVPLQALVDDLVSLVSAVGEGRPLLVRGVVEPTVPPVVMADGSRLRQVLSNLMGNAAKFTDEGLVELRIDNTDDDRLRFRVTDTGRGIDADELDAIFEPFTSARTGGARVGAGLGLTIVQQLVTAMEGAIHVDSQVGVGSVFEVTLPLLRHDAPSLAAPVRRVEPRPRRATVLVVEDNQVNQLLARNQLGRLGYDCIIVGTGEEALRVLSHPQPPRIVLMDFQLPGIDGLETTRRLRASEPAGRRAVVIGVTASAMAADRVACTAAGMDDFLAKPVGLAALGAMLDQWVPSDASSDAEPTDPPDTDAMDVLAQELGDVSVVHQLVNTYLGEIAERTATIERASAAADAAQVRKAAHALRSSSFLLGLDELGNACKTLETAADPLDELAVVQGLAALVEAAERRLRNWQRTHPAVTA